jgi:hypothetical protein
MNPPTFVRRCTLRTPALLLVGAVLGGCYSHRPVTLDEVAAGDDVRVRVTAQEVDRLEAEIPLPDRVFRGTVVGAESGLLLQVPVPGSEATSTSAGPLFNRIRVAPDGLVEVEVRELDRVRTFGLVAAATAVATVVGIAAFESPDDPEGEGDKPNDNQDLIVFGIPLSFGW